MGACSRGSPAQGAGAGLGGVVGVSGLGARRVLVPPKEAKKGVKVGTEHLQQIWGKNIY